ncbi:MAG: Gldg family protein [Alphaproteobacteria bacterium]
MKKLEIVIKNELFRYFTSPLAYVYLVSFLLLNGSFSFYFGGFFGRGQANLDTMFSFQPWLYLIFIPGISMRLWAEEFRNKTIIQIVTTPISISTLVWGKFFAAWIFCGIALALTFPFWITINILGHPDNMVTLVAYLASFLLAGCILSISSTMSALTKNQVIALVLSFFANILFFLSGLDFVLGIFRTFAPISIVDMIASFSFLTHFDTMSKGLIELRDIVFFSSIILLFNFATILIVSFKTSGTSKIFKSNNKRYYYLSFAFILVGFIGLNLTANSLFRNIQYDATEEKLFTLSPSTKKILEDLPENLIVKFYYSPILGERNHEIRLMFDRIRILLNKYVSHSHGKIDYKIYNPKFLDRIEDEALNNNIQPIPVIDMNQNGYFGLSFSNELDEKTSIPFFSFDRQNYIEQDITQKIYELYHKKKNIGILTPLPVGDTQISDNVVGTKWAIIDKIQELYNVKFVSTPQDISDIDVLMILHPYKLPAEMIEEIKRYSRKGGKFFIAMDGATEATRLYSMANQAYTPSDLSGLDEFWGFKVYTDWVVADLDSAIMVDATSNYQTNPKFTQDIIQLRYGNDNFNPHMEEVSNLQTIMFSSVSPIVPTTDRNVFMPLIRASENSQIMPMSLIYDNTPPNELLKMFTPDKNTKILAARILSESLVNPFELIVVGDTDFMYDSFWAQTSNMLNKQFTTALFDNANFVMNSLDTLTKDTDLINLRGRTAKVRKFENIEKIRKSAQQAFAIKEADILEKMNKTKIELDEITKKRSFERREEFNADELALIAGVRKKLDNLRQDLSDIRLQNNNEIVKIEMILKLINIYLLPIFIILIVLIINLKRNKNSKHKNQKIVFNKELLLIASISALLLFVGAISTYLTDKREIDKYENKLLFEDLSKEINDVEKITLKTHQNELNFYKEENIWKLRGYESFPVYQERIKSFLASLLGAKYYEKKTDKAEYLEKFGLLPVEDEKSTNTTIELYDANDKEIAGLEIGHFDINIGRGAKAAYVKFNNKFQVWLVSIDFIDLSTNWNEWTYSTAWNLRFGRLQNAGQEVDNKNTVLLVRDLLNTQLLSEENISKTGKKIQSTSFNTENGDKITLKSFENNKNLFVNYQISEPIKNEHLKFFYETAKGKFYQISKEDGEKIEKF